MTKASKKREEKVYRAQAAMDKAPGSNKCRYLELPKGLTFFKPEKGMSYRLYFLLWTAGRHNQMANKGELTWKRFVSTHRYIGPNEDNHLCPGEWGGKCAVCEAYQKLRMEGDRSKEYWNKVLAPLKAKAREIMLVHILDDKKNPKNLHIWDESPSLFGDAFRSLYKKKERWQSFPDPNEPCVIEIDAQEKKIEANSCVDCSEGIVIEPQTKPMPDWLLEKVSDICVDDLLKETPYSRLKEMFLNTGGVRDEEEQESEEEEQEPEEVDEDQDDDSSDTDDQEDEDEDQDSDESEDDQDDDDSDSENSEDEEEPIEDDESDDEENSEMDEGDDKENEETDEGAEEEEEKPKRKPAKPAPKKPTGKKPIGKKPGRK